MKRLEININKNRNSFEEENNDLESILGHSEFPKDYSFAIKDFFIKEETEINYFEQKKPSLDIKEKIVLQSINDIQLGITNEEFQIILFDTSNDEKNENVIQSKIFFNDINRIVHKILHKKKMINGKEIKECIFYEDLNGELLELGEKLTFSDIDKIISNLKEKNKYFEFIAIKSIMISITNLMYELIRNYLEKNERLINNIKNEENKEDINIIELNIFEDIYKDFLSLSNICSSELEEFFILSINNFREKYQMHFTLSELFTDIFWNSIFHNKKLCTLFVDSYCNDEIYGDIRTNLKKILKTIFWVNIPLKHQIVELLGLHQLENNEKNDLMTLIVNQKNMHHSEIIKLEIEKENLNKINNKKTEPDINSNSNTNSNISKNTEKNNDVINDNSNTNNNNCNVKSVENIKYNIITARDISVIKRGKQNNISVNNNNITILNEENNTEKQKENKNKEKEDNYNNYLNNSNNNNNDNEAMDLEHKTVDEIYNYINDDKIVKNKRKKKSRKNKKVKKEEIIIEDNQEEIEDTIVSQFKEDLSDKLIHAGSITKIKPVISEEWIKIISTYN